MKTKTLLLLCLFMGIAANQLSAQGTRTYPYRLYKPGFVVEIICEGNLVEILSAGEYILRQPMHYKDGENTWWKGQVNNLIFTSDRTDEVFKGQIQDSWNEDLYHIRINLIGNMGSHYIINGEFDGMTWQLIESNTDCH